jgi:hypothetical protein
MYPKYIRTHKANGCPCSKNESQYTSDGLHRTYRPCAAMADYLLVGVENGETFSLPRCAAHTIAAITDTGASGPLREYYSTHGKLPAPEPMVEDSPEQAETMYLVRFAPQRKPGATVNDANSNDYSAAGPFTRSGAEQFAAQLASRTALVYCKIVTEND